MTLDVVIRGAAVVIEFGGSVVIAVAVARGRLLDADGVVAALGFKTAATLLKTIELQSWAAIGMFAAILTLRTVVKRVLVWEEVRLRSGD